MSFQHILFETRDGIAKITLNEPETRNALSLELRAELLDLFGALSADDSVKVVMLTGAGKAFCAGGDIRTMAGVTPVAGRRRLKNGHRLIRAMVDMEKPIIAVVNGVAAGAGVSLTLASDIVFASEDAKFHFSFVNIGLVPDWGEFYFLPMKVGMARAKELMFTGGPIDAANAERIGMINRVLPPSRLYEEADAFAQRLAKGPGQAYAMIKCALNRWPAPLETLLELESTMQAVAFASEDFSEGRAAFMEKRKPAYKGR